MRVPSAEHRQGLELLGHIRALALDQVEQLRPSTTARWDGVEGIPADDAAMAECAVYAGIVQLVDVIISDEALKTAVTARLGKGVR